MVASEIKRHIRLYIGISLFILSLISPLFGIIVAWTSWSTAIKATLIGLFTAGIPEVLALLAAAILGKENFDLLKSKVFSFLKKLRPTAVVNKTRYRIGLVLFVLPFVPTYIMGYAPEWLPDDSPMRLYVNILADGMFISSLFVLGGDFWDKLRALFIYEARADFSLKDKNFT